MKQLSQMHNPSAKGEKILTVPEKIKDYRPYNVTGNEYVSLPMINPNTGALERINVLHMGLKGLLEFCGSTDLPLLEPYVKLENASIDPTKTTAWIYEQGWLPRFTYYLGDLQVSYQIITPPETKGFVYIISLRNEGAYSLKVAAGFKGNWLETLSTIYTSKHPWGQNHMAYNPWTEALILEFKAPTGLAALALHLASLTSDKETANPDKETATPGKEAKPINEAVPVTAPNPALKAIEFSFDRQEIIPPGELTTVVLYCGVNLEGDGAGTTLVDLRRRGWENIRREFVQWLSRHRLESGNARLEKVLNHNLFFNYYYSQGKTIDTEELVLVTSRSPRYYVSAAFWPRDTFLWSFPAILIVNPQRAKEMLLTAFRRHLANAAIHSHYINGVVLYPGFELDQLCAYTLALENYLKRTGDRSILQQPEISSGLVALLDQLDYDRGIGVHLYSTFLDPSDDPVTYPYLTYANVLVWKMLNFLSEVFRDASATSRIPGVKPVDRELLVEEAGYVRRDIYKYCVVKGPFGPMFVWSTDAQGNYELYDNPPGSLQLLAHYGFCSFLDQVYLNTLRWAHSPHNPFYNQVGRYCELGSVHAPNPWLLAACNTLLATRHPEIPTEFSRVRRNAWELLLRSPMDNGLACETIDPSSGVAVTGLAFATCAGFLAYTLAGEINSPFKNDGADNG